MLAGKHIQVSTLIFVYYIVPKGGDIEDALVRANRRSRDKRG